MENQELPDNTPSYPFIRGLLIHSTGIGFGSAVVMWMLAWVLHLPGVSVPNAIAIPFLLLPLLLVCLAWLPSVAEHDRLRTGISSGLIAGLINLLILGSFIVEQPESTAEMGEKANSLGPNALLVIFGSIGISALIGGIAALIVRGKPNAPADSQTWLSRMAWVTALTYLPLIAVGGAVTSTNSGLAVPDAVTSYGAVSVLFPLKLMAEPRIFFEHSHRLFGTLAGLTTLVLMIRVLMGERRPSSKLISIVLFLAVSAQGVLGIIRVADKSTGFAIIHGIFAQLVFALAVVLALQLSPKWVHAEPSDEVSKSAKRARQLMTFAFIALLIQLSLGAVTRHLNSSHAMMSHMGFAFIATMLVLVAGAVCIRTGKIDPSGRAIRIPGIMLHGLVTFQFALGFAVLGLAWESADDVPALPTPETLDTAPTIDAIPALVATAHHVSGALLLATAACALAWSIRLAMRAKIR